MDITDIYIFGFVFEIIIGIYPKKVSLNTYDKNFQNISFLIGEQYGINIG